MEVSYQIYPSLLDAYLRLKRNDDAETWQQLFDKINKVPQEPDENRKKGIEFEKLVDDILDKKEIRTLEEFYLTDNFRYPVSLITGISGKLKNYTNRQKYIEAIVPSHLGNIKLYGIIDYGFPEMMVDLKGTSNYSYGKYRDKTQHPVYSLIAETNRIPTKAFKYIASDFQNMFIETYIPSKNMHDKLMILIYEFIRFIEHFKKYITDTKIFGHGS